MVTIPPIKMVMTGGFTVSLMLQEQTAGVNALKNRWLGRVAARVAVERPAGGFGGLGGFGRFEGGQTAGLNALKNRWLGRVAARVAVERPAEGSWRVWRV